jgi:hypothetical protein
MSAISQRLMPSTYVGGLIRYIEPVVTLVESWSTHSSSNIRSWVARQLDWLQKTIAEETKRSEEDVVRYS